VLANDKIFPGRAREGWHSETWIFGGAEDPDALEMTDHHLLDCIERARSAIHGEKSGEIEHSEVSRWPQAIPHYNLSLERLTFPSEGNYIPFGTYLGDLGLGRVLLRAQELARSLH
jgi:oxygen-dependent protoporphyrinogen oxidase